VAPQTLALIRAPNLPRHPPPPTPPRHARRARREGIRKIEQESAHGEETPPVHPGEILREEFLVPLKPTPYAVAAALHVPRTRIERIAREEKPVTADTALRLGKFFKTGAAFWMNMQARFDLETAEDALAPQIRGSKKIASYEELRQEGAASRLTR
jgi:antitoxin HigA-1